MISRYTTPEMAELWSDERKFRAWLQVELTAAEVLTEQGEIPAEAWRVIRRKADFSLERIYEIEAETHHDVLAFTTAVAEKVGPESRFIHLGLTSTDVVDTAQALLIRDATRLIETEIQRLMATLKEQAVRYRDLIVMGRTHGVHAEPTTFGMKLAVWHAEMQRNLERLTRASHGLQVGKISGPVGVFSHLAPKVEEAICRKLGIDYAKASTQTLQRDRHAEFICSLAILGGTYEKIATEIRHLQRTEVREAEEPFRQRQKGSSSMPHKRNPITCEQISGLARVLRANAMVALENMPLWHERDISHSSAERVILPDSTTLAHYLSIKLEKLLAELVVHEKNMARNLELTGGLHVSGALLLELVRKGALREDAYSWVQKNAMKVWNEGADFRELILADKNIKTYLDEAAVEDCFNSRVRTRHVKTIFERVFGAE